MNTPPGELGPADGRRHDPGDRERGDRDLEGHERGDRGHGDRGRGDHERGDRRHDDHERGDRRHDDLERGDRERVLFVDNFDSFTYNLVEYVSEYADTEVVRNTASLEEVRASGPDAVVISPGPGHPANERDVGVTTDVLRQVSPDVPTLGVCLGLEAAVYAYGGTVDRAPEPVHGKAFPVEHDGRGLFAGLEQGFQAGRYHSLVATAVPDCFEVSATTDHAGEALVMGIRHREHPIRCVQFHPESVLTAVGHDVIRNFLSLVRG